MPMRAIVLFGLTATLLAACGPVRPPAVFRNEERFVSEEGWRGERILKNGRLFYAALDSFGNDGRPDRWRHYRDGRLVRELIDLDADDLIDVARRYSPRTGWLVRIERYLDAEDRLPDWTVDSPARNRWRLRWDRNGDGKTDFIFLFSGAPNLLSLLDLPPDGALDLRKVVNPLFWQALRLDEDHDGTFETVLDYPLPAVAAPEALPQTETEPE